MLFALAKTAVPFRNSINNGVNSRSLGPKRQAAHIAACSPEGGLTFAKTKPSRTAGMTDLFNSWSATVK